MDIIDQQRMMFGQEHPFRVDFYLSREWRVVLHFTDFSNFTEQLQNDSDIIMGKYFDNGGTVETSYITKSKVVYYKTKNHKK